LDKKSYPQFPAVTAFTPEGRVLIALLRFLLRGVHLAKSKAWSQPPALFNDDPRHFSKSDLLFFAYKYYFQSPLKSENWEAVEQFFIDNPPTNFGFQMSDSKTAPSEIRHLKSEITLTAAGDLMPYEWIQPQYCEHLWDDIADDFFDADVTFANLETPIDTTQKPSLVPEVMLSNMLFNGDSAMFQIFNGNQNGNFTQKPRKKGERGFDIVSTANNHSLDMGEKGLAATLEFLDKKGIVHAGTARTPEEQQQVRMIERNGIRLAFIAHTFSLNQLTNPDDKPFLVNHLEVNKTGIDLTPIREDVERAKAAGADLVILSLHFGNAYQPFPSEHIVANAKRVFDECGVDILLGGHPHNAQPTARYDFQCPFSGVKKQGFMIFSFGDFVAYDIFNWCHLAIYLKMTISKFEVKSILNPQPSIPNTEGGKIVLQNPQFITQLTNVEVKPVYTCGVYRSRNDRELRFLDAKKLWKQLDTGEKPPFFKDFNVQEAQALKAFWDNFLAINLTSV
jgi:Bacterial capsule synthesis protein PGA_cap